ncbi:MAG: hypothetical protein ACE5EO_05815 [Candidatus Krumholzibacteriia bacterium]
MVRTAFLLLGLTICSPRISFGQAGAIGTYADPGGIECNVTDNVPGLMPVYVVHTIAPGATASQFAAPMPACMLGAVYLSDSQVFPVTIGNSQDGVAIGYGVCLASPIHVLTINYFGNGGTTTCCMYAVVPDPNAPSGRIEVVDCGGPLAFGTGLVHPVNADANCNCQPAVLETTWGRLKSLYGRD